MIHRIMEDLREVNGRPFWLWRRIWRGTYRFEQLLAAHAALEDAYPSSGLGEQSSPQDLQRRYLEEEE